MALAPDDKDQVRYNVTLPTTVNDALQRAADELQVSKAEAIRRALMLFQHAVDADKVELTKAGEKQTVLVK